MKYLVDTSLWIEHLRFPRADLSLWLASDLVVVHPWVIGELSCGNMRHREDVLTQLMNQPRVRRVDETRCFSFIEERKLFGRGVGWTDVQLLLCCLEQRLTLKTLDRRLQSVAKSIGVA